MNERDLQAVAWDVDGTLIDSEPLHHEALIAISARYGVDLTNEPEERFRGVHMSDVWRALSEEYPQDLTLEAWNDQITDYYVQKADDLRPIPGAVETVRRLADMGVPQVCVSNSSRRIIDSNIRSLGIQNCLAGSVSLSDVTRGKPNPEPYVRGVGLLGLPANSVLAIEDSATGALSARRARLAVGFYNPRPGSIRAFDYVDYEIIDLSAIPDMPFFAERSRAR
ncbi:HAD family phosphatase [Breoghania sp.]|uniref:HAD family hydrolase n=1 Tax=Breoghania sp. TaxID=2065378 RepID=UPI002AAAA059|nr:HAD family phosphatase [Breoghania sp.]